MQLSTLQHVQGNTENLSNKEKRMRKSKIKLLWYLYFFNKDIAKRFAFTREEKRDIRHFSEFLVSHNAFNNYFFNFNSYMERCGQYTVSSEIRPWSYIQCAFTWANTPEGGLFWSTLNEEWHNKLKL